MPLPAGQKKMSPQQILQKRLSGRYKELLEGDLTVQDLDTDELIKGRLKNAQGKFVGRPPEWLPHEILAAMHKELIRRVKHNHIAGVDESYKELRAILKSQRLPADARVKAAALLLDRLEGKVTENVNVTAQVEARYEMIEPELIIDLDDEDIVDAEIEE